MLNTQSWLSPLQQQGLINGLDRAFAEFIATQEPRHGRSMAIVAALLSQQLASQHVCVSLGELTRLYNDCLGELDLDLPMLFESELQQILERAHTVSRPDAAESVDRPIVLQQDALYLQRYWLHEQRLAERLSLLADKRLALDIKAGKAMLESLFGSLEPQLDWQQVAVVLAASRQLCLITGGPGTGKTTTVTRLMALVQGLARQQGALLRIALVAPTGKAAARLTESIGQAREKLPPELRDDLPVEAATLHRLLGYQPNKVTFRHDRDNPLPLDMLILDEASMVDLPMMSKLLDALPEHARLVMLGDRQQLASVEVGSVLGDICQSLPSAIWQDEKIPQFTADTCELIEKMTGMQLPVAGKKQSRVQDNLVMLRKSHRFADDSGVGRLARAVNQGNFKDILLCLSGADERELDWRTLDSVDVLVEQVCDELGGYFAAVRSGDIGGAFSLLGRQQLLCASRRGPWGVEQLNRRIELALTRRGWIRPEQDFYPGCPIMVGQNDYQVRLFNGDVGICMTDEQGLLKVWFMDAAGQFRALLPSRVPASQRLYAMTIHKSQGSEFEHAILSLGSLAQELVSKELLYTAITRARNRVTLYARAELLRDALQTHSLRGSGLAGRLTAPE
ncbi:exodeoxyribonuclease V subunit alpha [Bowmanella dokdonensis]|uniref:RecBCD enzyme subunit RecD n=1 Tax=Bowmanella dokdonensis TaxID=751969 RepID=A0A939DL03_9ALTE|nr:exodeoxyribonuclease V subunit alpha [Bowmanella dokdonensis]MBN7824659.1 exodeoxyribonuclease V subunit alpha [Bowmanella dokdonensis]